MQRRGPCGVSTPGSRAPARGGRGAAGARPRRPLPVAAIPPLLRRRSSRARGAHVFAVLPALLQALAAMLLAVCELLAELALLFHVLTAPLVALRKPLLALPFQPGALLRAGH